MTSARKTKRGQGVSHLWKHLRIFDLNLRPGAQVISGRNAGPGKCSKPEDWSRVPPSWLSDTIRRWKKRLLASTTALGMWRIVLLLSSAWPVPNHRKIKIMGKKWWLKSDAKAPLASDTGLHGQPLGHLPLFFSKFRSAKRRSNSTSCQLVPLRMSTVL